MFELIRTGQNTYYIKCHSNIGVFCTGRNDIYLIDTAYDDHTGEEILEIARRHNWRIKGIVNTHSHIDHIGGNKYIQQTTGCDVFISGIEKAFIDYPELGPAFIYGGFPCRDICDKYLKPYCRTKSFASTAFPKELEVIPLPGHFLGMAGVRTPDNTVFLADSICSKKVLDKSGIMFIYDIGRFLDTLDHLEKIDGKIYVPSHAEATDNISELIDINRQKVYKTEKHIHNICQKPQSTDSVLSAVLDIYKITATIENYALLGFTIRSYLSWMTDNNRMTIICDGCRLLWHSI